MRYYPQDLYIKRIRGKAPGLKRFDWLREMSVKECFAKLRELSGQDFGEDVNAWAAWWRKEKRKIGPA
jgi:hypothetical protein